MEILSPMRLAVGCLFLVIGAVQLWQSRRDRGFGQKRQLGALLLVAGAIFAGLGLGLIRT